MHLALPERRNITVVNLREGILMPLGRLKSKSNRCKNEVVMMAVRTHTICPRKAIILYKTHTENTDQHAEVPGSNISSAWPGFNDEIELRDFLINGSQPGPLRFQCGPTAISTCFAHPAPLV